MNQIATVGPVALQRCNTFVGRTMNWLYDHLRFLTCYTPVVLCDQLENREEFPALEAWALRNGNLTRRIWRRVAGTRLYPSDLRKIRRYAPNVVHSHFGYVAVNDFELVQSLDVPWFVSFYGADVYALGRKPEWQERYARLFDKAARVLALGPVMAECLTRLGCPRERVMIHPLGVEVSGLPSEPRLLESGEPLRILFAGTFREKKGIGYVVEAAALARSAGVKLELHLVGDAGDKPGDRESKVEVFQKISRLAIDDVVVHHSFLSFRELVTLALRSHVFVAPSITAADGDAEGTPFVLQQMIATAMPAIATVHSDIPYLFGEHSHLLVPERDAASIANRLREYAEQPDLLVQHGVMLREKIRQAFDISKCAAHLRDLYDAAC